MKKLLILIIGMSFVLCSCSKQSKTLNSLHIANEAIIMTNDNFYNNIESLYSRFQRARTLDTRVEPFYNKVLMLKQYTKDIIEYIESVKSPIDSNKTSISSNDVTELKTKIAKYRSDVLQLIDPNFREQVEKDIGLNTEGVFYDIDKKEQNWEKHYFGNSFSEADELSLNCLINEIRTAEFYIINQLGSMIEGNY